VLPLLLYLIFLLMTRVTRGFVARRRRTKIFHAVRGCRAGRVRLFRTANQQAMKSRAHMYTSRKQFKRTIRQVWIKRINAAVRHQAPGMTYSRFMHVLARAACRLNRKSLAQLAAFEPAIFTILLTRTYG
jgi:large subunit ribosomal protein L20